MSAPDWDVLMDEAIALAASPDAPRGLNPRVGCVIVDAEGSVRGRGYHLGAGTAHAEVVALAEAGAAARGATALVSLEPCRHTGRTGPCTEALIAAGIARVVYAQADPTAQAGGGAEVLRAAGIEVVGGVREAAAHDVNRLWTHVQRTGRPYVTAKLAVSLDGRVADATGGPTAISGVASRAFAHDLRAQVDAIAVGTGTVIADDPQLTARDPEGLPRARQPLRVVLGDTEIPGNARILDDAAPTVRINGRDPMRALAQLADLGIQHVLLEGGPTILTAWLAADVVDDVVWFIAPILLGDGPVGVLRMDCPLAVDVRSIRPMGDDVVVIGTVRRGQ